MHKSYVSSDPISEIDNAQIVVSISKNIEDLGFVFSKKLFAELRYCSNDYLIALYNQIIPILTEMVGSHVDHKPFYINFPQQMASLSEVELLINALLHYWTEGQWKPDYAEQARFPLDGNSFQIRVIDAGSIDDFIQIFMGMVKSKGSLSNNDRNLLSWYLEKASSSDLFAQLPEYIPSKETLSLVVGKILEFHSDDIELVTKYIKTATDVLRLITSLSDGDVSLADNTKYKNFSRSERKLFLSLLNKCKNIEEDMARYTGKWIRVGEKLHPGDYSSQFPIAFEAFRKIRNNEKTYSFLGEVERFLQEEDLTKALGLLQHRPGELARRLDYLLRTFPNHNQYIIDSFSGVANQVSSQVLLQLHAHFKNHHTEKTSRSFFPKGNVAKVRVVENNLAPISDEYCRQVVSICENELIKQFSNKSPLGKVYIHPNLQDMVVPIAQRSSNRALKTYARGSRFHLNDNVRTIRAFIHWKNILQKISITEFGFSNTSIKQTKISETRVDIDLSLGLYDSNWDYIEHISYTNLRSNEISGLYHSGDIVNAPDGATEFIDFDIEYLRLKQVRYLVFNIYSFSLQGFDKIPECFFGWMEREKPQSGEVFEPKTVVNKVDLTSSSRICLPVLFDIEDMKVIWMDIALKANPKWVNNIESNSNNVVLMSKAMIELVKPNLFDLFWLNARARGEIVDSPEKAEIIFGIDETCDVNPFQIERILSEFL